MLVGCASNEHGTEHSNNAAGQQSSYDPTTDTTTIENQGYTWRLKGNVTNVMMTPTNHR